MSRSLVLVVMVLSLLWQAASFVRGDVASGPVADLAHAALHWQDEPHHHHDGGAYHLDDSAESARHALSDPGNVSTTLCEAFSQDFAPAGTSAPCGAHARPAAHPFLDGLLRPPRLHA